MRMSSLYAAAGHSHKFTDHAKAGTYVATLAHTYMLQYMVCVYV